MQSIAQKINDKQKKSATVDVRSGDTVRVHQKVQEGGKERIQIFEGLVIRVSRRGSLSARFSARRIASGVGVEKSFLLHSPSILKVEVTKRARVRRNYLTYMRGLTGKSSRLSSVDFDRDAVNAIQDEAAEAEEAKIHEAQVESYDPEAAKAEKEQEAADAKEAAATKSEADKAKDQPAEKSDAKASETEQGKE